MPRPSESAETTKPRKRRRRRFGNRTKKLPPENHAGQGFGVFADGVSATLGPIYWLWRMAASTLSWSSSQIAGEGGGVRSANAGLRTSGANNGMETLLPGVVLVCGAVAGMLVFRYDKPVRHLCCCFSPSEVHRVRHILRTAADNRGVMTYFLNTALHVVYAFI